MGLLQQLSGYHQYSYNYGYNSDMEEFAEALAVLSATLIPVMIISSILGIAIYVFRSLSLMTLAKNRGLSSPAISWVPFCSGYALGRISDDISARKGIRTSHRKILLAMEIVSAACMIVGAIIMIAPMIDVIIELADNSFNSRYLDEDALAMSIVGSALGGLVVMLIGAVCAIIQAVFLYIAMYRVFKAYAPDNAVLYLILSIFISICYPIFLFIIRDKQEVIPQAYPPYGGYTAPYQTYTPNGQPYSNSQYQQPGGQQPYQQYQTYQPQPQPQPQQTQQPAPPQLDPNNQNPQQ